MKKNIVLILSVLLWVLAPAVVVSCRPDINQVVNTEQNETEDNGDDDPDDGDDPDPTPDPNPDPDPTPDPNPDPDPEPGVTVLDPGQTAPEQDYRPQHPELEHTVSYSDFYSPVQDDLDPYGNVDYVCSQGGGTSWPVITSNSYIRLYQGTSSIKGGSYIRLRSHNGATLESVTIGTANDTQIAWYFERRPSTQSATESLAAGAKKTLTCPDNCTEVCFLCMATDDKHRWEVNYISITYKGGFIESDFFVPEAEYGPLVQVKFPFEEGFEKDFKRTDTPTYNKYGLTSGRENLQWSTWFGSFSWQKAISGEQSAQLRVYQEDADYQKSQFGHLKMEYFIKDLRKVSFKYCYSELWNKAVISYCEFGSNEHKNPVMISLNAYSERQTVKDFCYILDGGKPHDAKIIIEIDPATGHPGNDHYDFYFDDFVFE